MKVTYYGHSCFGIETQGQHILFDPFITPNPLASAIDISNIKANYILVSHGHQDHVADVKSIAQNTDSLVISNFEIINWFGSKGVAKLHPMSIGGQKKLDFGKIKYVNAIHASSMPDGTYGGSPGGFVVDCEEKKFYFAGDTALTYDMKLLKEFHQLNFAFLPIGDNFTMGVDDAILAADFIGCTKIIGMHYDTFPYIEIDKEEALEKFQKAGLELILFVIGETKEL